MYVVTSGLILCLMVYYSGIDCCIYLTIQSVAGYTSDRVHHYGVYLLMVYGKNEV